MREQKVLLKIKEICQRILGEKLTGVYVHGSIAFQCFNWEKSDIDFIIVVKEKMQESEKQALISQLLAMENECPSKGLEMSVVLEKVCDPFVYPTPFELHFSNAHRQKALEDLPGFCEKMNGTDIDLAAHFTVIRAVGITLYGKAASEVFEEVPKEDYLDSIRQDAADAAEHLEENPVYLILNYCRVLAFLREGFVLSKKQGGEWGLQNLSDEWKALVKEALECYGENLVFAQGMSVVREFADEMLDCIKNASCEN